MFWIIATTAFLMVFGGILFVLPSKKERQIGKMRIDARKTGLHTQSVVVKDVNAPMTEKVTAGGQIRNPKVQCIAWEKRYLDQYTGIPKWILYEASKGDEPFKGYTVEPPIAEFRLNQESEYWRRVGRAIDQLPRKIVAVKSSQDGVAWIGHERLDSTPDEFIGQILTGLNELAEANVEFSQGRISD